MLQLFPPTGNNCNKFGGRSQPKPKLLHLLPPTGNNCNKFGASGVCLITDKRTHVRVPAV
jgi:hypothetical protein